MDYQEPSILAGLVVVAAVLAGLARGCG